MTLPKIGLEGISIILLGSFNPAIFQPAWLAAQNLISPAEAEKADIELVHNEVTQFTADWLKVQVVHDRFSASTAQTEYFDVLRDFVVGTFSVLPQTPVKALGLNSDRHYEMESADAWDHVGKVLAPPDSWAAVLEKPGMRKLMMQGVREDDFEGAIHVTVEPSIPIEYGVYVNYNDHYRISTDDVDAGSAEYAATIIKGSWEGFLDRPNAVGAAIFEATR